MSSTNKTTHYELSQYIGSDKPTYLVDYNTDMYNIDAGIYSAKSEADTNSTSIGTLSNLTTESKSDLVSAINEVDNNTNVNASNIATNTGNITTNTNNIATNTASIGTLANLETTSKTSCVSAINEIVEKFNLNTINTYSSSNVSITGGTISSGSISIAKNSDSSICKIYGKFRISKTAQTVKITIPNAGFNVSEDITISPVGCEGGITSDNLTYITIKTNGDVVLTTYGASSGTNITAFFFPVLIFVTSFGDIPNA